MEDLRIESFCELMNCGVKKIKGTYAKRTSGLRVRVDKGTGEVSLRFGCVELTDGWELLSPVADSVETALEGACEVTDAICDTGILTKRGGGVNTLSGGVFEFEKDYSDAVIVYHDGDKVGAYFPKVRSFRELSEGYYESLAELAIRERFTRDINGVTEEVGALLTPIDTVEREEAIGALICAMAKVRAAGLEIGCDRDRMELFVYKKGIVFSYEQMNDSDLDLRSKLKDEEYNNLMHCVGEIDDYCDYDYSAYARVD